MLEVLLSIIVLFSLCFTILNLFHTILEWGSEEDEYKQNHINFITFIFKDTLYGEIIDTIKSFQELEPFREISRNYGFRSAFTYLVENIIIIISLVIFYLILSLLQFPSFLIWITIAFVRIIIRVLIKITQFVIRW